MKRLFAAALALLLASPALAHEVKLGDLLIIHANIPAPAASAKSAGGYMAISNEGSSPDRLIGVEVGFAAQAMLHTTEFTDGIASMKHIEALEIPAGETVVLERGGYHIMLMGLSQTLTEGDMLPATLIFEHAGRVEIEFMVDPPAARMDHGAMDHSGHQAAPAASGTTAGHN